MNDMLQGIEDRFADGGRTPKGQRARRAIFRATYEAVAEAGPAASLENIAARANLTQAALRHHFSTRDELLMTFFLVASQWLRSRLEQILSDHSLSAKAKLEQAIAWHLEFMENVNTVVWLETSAFWLHKDGSRQTRDAWYRWLTAQYAELIGHIQPNMSRLERQHRAYLVLTLVLGAWITHGRGSRVDTSLNVLAQRRVLIDAAMSIVEG
jgi:AcrR family transcriptional regulator